MARANASQNPVPLPQLHDHNFNDRSVGPGWGWISPCSVRSSVQDCGLMRWCTTRVGYQFLAKMAVISSNDLPTAAARFAACLGCLFMRLRHQRLFLWQYRRSLARCSNRCRLHVILYKSRPALHACKQNCCNGGTGILVSWQHALAFRLLPGGGSWSFCFEVSQTFALDFSNPRSFESFKIQFSERIRSVLRMALGHMLLNSFLSVISW